MYSRGSRCIYFIFVDSTILTTTKRIGTLRLHEGIILDHVILYMDCDEHMLFGGIINRSVINLSREFVLEHADECKAFLKVFRSYTEANQIIDTEIKECLLGASRKVGRKK